MLSRGLGHPLLFEPIRAYYGTMRDAGITQWRPYITEGNATPAQRAAFRKVFTGEMAQREHDIAHTDRAAVGAADALVIKMVRGLCSLRWMVDTFEPRHTFVLLRNPFDAIDSQLRRPKVLQGTPQHKSELSTFFARHPEVPAYEPQTGVEWLATYWAIGYYAAADIDHPRVTALRYEDLVGNITAVREQVFEPLGESLPHKRLLELVSTPSMQTKRPTGFPNRSWVPVPAKERVLSRGQRREIRDVVERFPGLREIY